MKKWKKRLQGLFATSLALSCVGLSGIQFFLTPHANVWAEETEISAESEAASPRFNEIVAAPIVQSETYNFFTINTWTLYTKTGYTVTTDFRRDNQIVTSVENQGRYVEYSWSDGTAVDYAYSYLVENGVTYQSEVTYVTAAASHTCLGEFSNISLTKSVEFITSSSTLYLTFGHPGVGTKGFEDRTVSLPVNGGDVLVYFNTYKGELGLTVHKEAAPFKYSITIFSGPSLGNANFGMGDEQTISSPICLFYGV